MLDPASWKQHTAGLDVGRSRRVDHDCGGGRTLRVSHEGDGAYKAWCFRCGELGVIEPPLMSLSERLAALARTRNAEELASSSVSLPEPRHVDPQHWPLAARVWLYKAGLSNDDIESIGAYYHPDTKRVVLPVYRDGDLIYWQARDVTWTRATRGPKYINPVVSKDKLYAAYGTGPAIALTEDILSAYRVGRVTEAWSLMGTTLTPGVIAALIKRGLPVVLMFDPDSGGEKANTAAYRRLGLMGIPISIGRPHRDPKYLTKEQTFAVLNSAVGQQQFFSL